MAWLVLLTFLVSVLTYLRLEMLMSHFGAQYDDLLTAIEANTTAVAAAQTTLIEELKAARANGDPMTDEQFARLEAIRDHLKALGSDVQAPVPAVPAAVLPAPVVTDAPASTLPAAPTVSDPAPESTPTL